MDELRRACAAVAGRARHVEVVAAAVPGYADGLAPRGPDAAPADDLPPVEGDEARAAYVLTLDAINFGSGWFPTLRKRDGRSGYRTVEAGLRARVAAHGPWPAADLAELEREELARTLDQDPDHELVGLWTAHLRELGGRVGREHDGRFLGPVEAAGGSAVALAHGLAAWPTWQDVSSYDELFVPFLKRAQLAAADLHRAGLARFSDLPRLTIFADNLVPHVLRLDGVLRFAPALVARIEAGELLEHGSPEEVEIRACAVHAVELIVAARGDTTAAAVDYELWERGGGPRYKARPRHRARCTAY